MSHSQSGISSPYARYIVAVVITVAAFLARQGLSAYFAVEFPRFVTFYPAVMVAAIYGGIGPGLTATILSTLLLDLWVFPPYGHFAIDKNSDVLALAFFSITSAAMSLVAERYRRGQRKLVLYREQEAVQEWRRATLRSIGDAVLATDTEGKITFLNPVAIELTEWTLEQAQGQSVEDVFRIINEQTGAKGENIVERVLREGHAVELANHTALITRNGRAVPIEDSAAPILDSKGKIKGVVLVFHDVTERRRKEEQLQRLNRTLAALSHIDQALLRATSEDTLLQDVCRIITDDCGHAMVWIGYAEHDEEKSVRPVAYAGFEQGYLETLRVSWADTERGRGPTGTAIRTGKPSACHNMQTDPKFAPWREQAVQRGYNSSVVLPLVSEGAAIGALTIYSRQCDAFAQEEVQLLSELAGNLAYGIGSLRARAAREVAEESLRSSEEKFAKAFDTNPAAIVLTRIADGTIVNVNEAFVRLYGFTREEILGRSALRLWPSPEERVRAVSELMAAGMFYGREQTMVRKSGDEFIALSSAVILNVAGEDLILSTWLDITDRKRAAEALMRSEKLALVGRMAASIAHEINNPLAAVMNTLFLARVSADDGEAVRNYLDTADDELRRISHITQQTLGFYRESTVPKTVSINSVVDAAVDLLRGKFKVKSATVEKRYSGEYDVTAVPGELRQVFANLLANSIDALPDKGNIQLRVSEFVNAEGKRQVKVTVADNGKGIDRATLPRIFEPLFTTKEATGSGLGLWVSKEIIDKHQGSIRVRSRTKGQYRGTLVTVVLPAKASALAAKSTHS